MCHIDFRSKNCPRKGALETYSAAVTDAGLAAFTAAQESAKAAASNSGAAPAAASSPPQPASKAQQQQAATAAQLARQPDPEGGAAH